jgi:hypothetical protein
VGEDEVFEPVRGQLHGCIGRLTVREVTMLRGDPALQARRVRAPPEPVEIVVRLEYYSLRPAHASQYLDTGLPEIRRHCDCATVVGDSYPVGHGVVRDFEESHGKVADSARLSWGYGVGSEGFAYAGSGEDLDVLLVQHGPDAAGVVGMSVGQEDGSYVGQIPAYTGEESLYAPSREPGVNEEPTRASLHIGRIARASA